MMDHQKDGQMNDRTNRQNKDGYRQMDRQKDGGDNGLMHRQSEEDRLTVRVGTATVTIINNSKYSSYIIISLRYNNVCVVVGYSGLHTMYVLMHA